MKAAVQRILDANFNRVREGLRVSEDVARLALNHRRLSADLKRARHDVTTVYKALGAARWVQSRDSDGDVGRAASPLERPRLDLAELFWANLERAKEALRALEEVSKLAEPQASETFKSIRFKVYAIEKRAYPAVEALRDRRPRRRR